MELRENSVQVEKTTVKSKIRAQIRMDFRGVSKSGRLLFGGKNGEKAAEELRDQQGAFYRNVPAQGVNIEDIDMGMDVYTVFDEVEGKEVAFAPLVLTIGSESWDDIAKFVAKEEFRTIDIIEPQDLTLTKTDMEKLLYRFSQEMDKYRQNLERKMSYR